MEQIIKNDIPKFGLGSVPVSTAAKIFGRDATWVRAGIVKGWLPIGIATRDGQIISDLKDMDSRYGRITYTIFPRRLWELTGYVWEGKGGSEEDLTDQFRSNCKEFVDEIMDTLFKEDKNDIT